MKTKDNRTIFIDTWTTNNYHICNESEVKEFQNESAFQSIYSNIENSNLSPKILCVIEGRWSKDNAVSVNGRYYGDFWRKQLAKEQTQFLLKKGLMYMMFGHVDRGIEDKDVENGEIAGIVTHLQVIDHPTTINGRQYDKDDLFGRAIIIESGGKNAGLSTYSLLSVGSEISISSRGLGEYIVGETHQCEDGSRIPIMNPDTYELETFDFTRLPGISCAEVHMVRDNLVPNDMPNNGIIEDGEDDFTFESLEVTESELNSINESLNELIFNIKEKENDMPKVNGAQVNQVLEDANAKIKELTAKLETAEKERDAALAKATEAEEVKDDEIEAEEVEEKEEQTETVEAGTEPEPPVENPEAVDTTPVDEKPVEEVDMVELDKVEAPASNEELDAFKEIADDPEELKATLIKVEETLKKCECDAKELKDTKEKLEAAEEEIEEKDKEIADAEQALESYVKLGSIAELKAMVESNRKMKLEARNQKLAQFTKHYSVKKGITLESVKRIIDSSKSFKDARQVLESLPNANPNKGLYMGESAQKPVKAKASLSTFAESMIDKMEKRRNRTYTA